MTFKSTKTSLFKTYFSNISKFVQILNIKKVFEGAIKM